MTRGKDLVSLVLEDHGEHERQLQDFADSPPTGRRERFMELAEAVVRHELAEELVLYPVIEMEPGGSAVAQARLSEQSLLLELLGRMEHVDPDNAEFGEMFETLRTNVVEHDRSEEEFVLPMIGQEPSVLEQVSELYVNLMASVPSQHGLDLPGLASKMRENAPELNRARVSADRR